MNETILQAMKIKQPTPAGLKAKTIASDSSSRSFEELFLEYWPQVYQGLVRLVGDPAEAEDLALETFLRFYRQSPPSANGFNLGGWLHRVAVNLGLHSIRSFKRRERYELSAGKNALEEAPETRPAEILAREEDQRMARTVLSRMNPRQAELLVMRYSGSSYKAIASALGVAPSSIGPYLLRAEREFEKRYRALLQEEP
jgi:RNA polymerase sigma factor (sigma-70 family)